VWQQQREAASAKHPHVPQELLLRLLLLLLLLL
jgi:hypothetical protein